MVHIDNCREANRRNGSERMVSRSIHAVIHELKRSQLQRRSGNAVILTAVLLVVLFAMVAFAIDVGYVVHARTELQRTADACAMAAVMCLPDNEEAQSVAQSTALQNRGTLGPDLEASDVEFGIWDRDTAQFNTPATGSQLANAVRVSVKRTSDRGNALRLFFAPIIGTCMADAEASAIAARDKDLCGPFIGIEWLSVPGDVVTDSYNSQKAPYHPSTARHRGSLCSDGPIGLDGTVLIQGDARAGKGYRVTIEGGPIVTGNIGSRKKPLNLPSVDTTEVEAVNDNNNLPMIPEGNSWKSPIDGNRNFLLDGNKIYDMPPGNYFLNDFVIEGQSVLNISGPTTIYLSGNLLRAGGTIVNNSTQVPANLKIMMTGNTATVTSSDAFYGVIYAPDTNVQLDGSSDYYGAVVGKTLTVTGGAQGHYDESLKLEEVELPTRTTIVD